MGCRCKDNVEQIENGYTTIAKLRDLFIKRMTIDSKTHDRRRRDYNMPIFLYREDGSTRACWNDTDMDMVLECFDNAVKDWRRSWCDVENCTRNWKPNRRKK